MDGLKCLAEYKGVSAVMKRVVLSLVSACVFMGSSCTTLNTSVPSIGVACANQLDASAFGFSLTVPSDFQCIDVTQNENLLVSVRYRQGSSGPILSVVLGPTGQVSTSCDGGGTCEDLDPLVTANGVTFSRVKVSAPSLGVTSYLGFTTLSSGNVLGITLAAFSDDASLLTTVNTVFESVVLN